MERELFLLIAATVGVAGPLAVLLWQYRGQASPVPLPDRPLAEAVEAAFAATGAGVAVFDARERLVLATGRYADLFGLRESDLTPGRPLTVVLQAIAYKGQAADAIGREQHWIETCLHAHRQRGQPVLQRGRGDRWLCLSVGATAESCVVQVASDVGALGGTRRQIGEEIGRLARHGRAGFGPDIVSAGARAALAPLGQELQRQAEALGAAARSLHAQAGGADPVPAAVDQAVAGVADLADRYRRLAGETAPAAA